MKLKFKNIVELNIKVVCDGHTQCWMSIDEGLIKKSEKTGVETIRFKLIDLDDRTDERDIILRLDKDNKLAYKGDLMTDESMFFNLIRNDTVPGTLTYIEEHDEGDDYIILEIFIES